MTAGDRSRQSKRLLPDAGEDCAALRLLRSEKKGPGGQPPSPDSGYAEDSWQGVEKCKKSQSELAILLNTLHENWLRSSIFSPAGGDKREGAGC